MVVETPLTEKMTRWVPVSSTVGVQRNMDVNVAPESASGSAGVMVAPGGRPSTTKLPRSEVAETSNSTSCPTVASCKPPHEWSKIGILAGPPTR